MTRAWILGALGLLLLLSGPVLLFAVRDDAAVYSLCFGAVQLSTACVGGVLASRLPANRVGWILLSIACGMGLSVSASVYGEIGTSTSRGPLPADEIGAWLGEWTLIPVVFGGVMYLLYVFPDGRFLSPRWRRAGYASLAVVLLASVSDALAPGQLENVSQVRNPVGARGAFADVVLGVQQVVDALGLPAFVLALVALGTRLRRSRGVERQQLKWIAYAMGIVALGLGLSAASPASVGDGPFLLALLALAAMPVATGMAVLRYRLYDIDLVINRTLVYGALTGLLAGFYAGSVLLLQLVLNPSSQVAIAVSTLSVATVFRPARARVQGFVDRRFFRSRYDAALTLQGFSSRVRDEVDLDVLAGELQTVVREAMQPAHISLWLHSRP